MVHQADEVGDVLVVPIPQFACRRECFVVCRVDRDGAIEPFERFLGVAGPIEVFCQVDLDVHIARLAPYGGPPDREHIVDAAGRAICVPEHDCGARGG